VKLSVASTFGSSLRVNFTVANPHSDRSISVLSYGTPLEGDLYGASFEIYDRSGNPVAYVGKIGRRVWPPVADSFIQLAPSTSMEMYVDLADHYDFASAVPGHYMVRFVGSVFGTEFGQVFPASNWLLVEYRGDAKQSSSDIDTPFANINCKANENTEIATAVAGSKTETLKAHNCMSQRTCDAQAVRWFGVHNKANFDYDTAMFNKVHARLVNFPFKAHCNPAGCGANVYAYVYPNDATFTVYLCGAFWSQANERVNTVVHEMSHFTSLGGTDDYAYGQSACLALAKSNPQRASHNADNVCYFSASV